MSNELGFESISLLHCPRKCYSLETKRRKRIRERERERVPVYEDDKSLSVFLNEHVQKLKPLPSQYRYFGVLDL